jgi:hypothetical protein
MHLRVPKLPTGDPRMTIAPSTSPEVDHRVRLRNIAPPAEVSAVSPSSGQEMDLIRGAQKLPRKTIKITVGKEPSHIPPDGGVKVDCQTCGFHMLLEGSESDWVSRIIVCPQCNEDFRLAFPVPVRIRCPDCATQLVLDGRTEHWIRKTVVCPKCSLGIDVAKSTRVCPFCSADMAFVSSHCPSCGKDLASGKAMLLKLRPRNDKSFNMPDYLPHGIMRHAFDRWLWHRLRENVRSFVIALRLIRASVVFIIAAVLVAVYWRELRTVVSVIVGGFVSLLLSAADILSNLRDRMSR